MPQTIAPMMVRVRQMQLSVLIEDLPNLLAPQNDAFIYFYNVSMYSK